MECQAALKALDQLKSCFFSLRVETYHSIFPLKQWVCPGTVRINVMAINDATWLLRNIYLNKKYK